MDGLQEDWGQQVLVVQVDIHQAANRPLVRRLEARFTPTFVLLDQAGEVAWRQVGAIDPAEALRQVALLIKNETGG